MSPPDPRTLSLAADEARLSALAYQGDPRGADAAYALDGLAERLDDMADGAAPTCGLAGWSRVSVGLAGLALTLIAVAFGPHLAALLRSMM